MPRRTSSPTRRVVAGLALTGLASAVPAFAADVSRNDEPLALAQARTTDVITVTAQRREENIQDVPSAIATVGGDKLIESGLADRSEDIVQFVGNVSAAATSNSTRPRWWIRGIGTGTQNLDTPSPVGVYFDDVYYANASATGVPIYDLERVEVLKGPQGTLFGKNTTGGLLHFISRRPTFDPSGYARVDYGRFDRKVLQGAYGSAVVDDRIAARVSFHHQSDEGAFYNALTGEKTGAKNDTAARVQVLGVLNETTELLVRAHLRSSSADTATQVPQRGGPAAGTDITRGDRRAVVSNVPSPQDTDQSGISATLTWALGDYELTAISSVERWEQLGFTDRDASRIEAGRQRSDASTRQVSQEIRIASPTHGPVSWVAGLLYFRDNTNVNDSTATLPIPINDRPDTATFNNLRYDFNGTSYAAFGNLRFDITDRFAVTTGLRYTYEEKDVDLTLLEVTGNPVAFNDESTWWRPESVDTPLQVSVRQVAKESWNEPTWDITPQYQLTPEALVYGRVARGFRSGGFNTGAASQEATNVIQPEFLTSYEVGAKTTWWNGRLIANAAVFTYTYDDIILNFTPPAASDTAPSVTQLTNATSGSAYGAELDVDLHPFDGLSIRLSLGYLQTEFDDFVTAGGDYTGNEFVRAPRLSGALGVDYRWSAFGGYDLELGTDWNSTSRQFYYADRQTPAESDFFEGGHTIGNARLSLHSPDDRFTVTAFVNNVTDKLYKIHVSPNGRFAPTAYNETRSFGLRFITRF